MSNCLIQAYRRGFVSSAAHWWRPYRSKTQNQSFLCFGNALGCTVVEIHGIRQLKAGAAAQSTVHHEKNSQAGEHKNMSYMASVYDLLAYR